MLDISNAERISETALSQLTTPLTNQLRQMASTSGWPANLTNALFIKYDNNYNLYIDYPSELATEIEDKEYGELNGLPNAAIRPFMYRSQAMIAALIADKVIGELFEEMGIL